MKSEGSDRRRSFGIVKWWSNSGKGMDIAILGKRWGVAMIRANLHEWMPSRLTARPMMIGYSPLR